jgi:hypothetical protein
MAGNQLILNKGYKLQDINITSAFNGPGGGAGTVAPAVIITHPTAGLASVDVKCTGAIMLSAWRLRELAPIPLGM